MINQPGSAPWKRCFRAAFFNQISHNRTNAKPEYEGIVNIHGIFIFPSVMKFLLTYTLFRGNIPNGNRNLQEIWNDYFIGYVRTILKNYVFAVR